jgi:hypothetical protein
MSILAFLEGATMLLKVGGDVHPKCSIGGRLCATVSRLLEMVGLGGNGVTWYCC